MEETLFPPSPNWYLPNVLDVANDGAVCWGSNTSLVVMNFNENADKEKLKVSNLNIIAHAHRERVSVVVFGPQGAYEKMVATIGGDSYVKVWDTSTGEMREAHQAHGSAAKLRGLDWSPANRQVIVSVDEAGTFVLFDIGANKSDKLTFPKLHATVLACCPHKGHWVAVGDISGLVWVVSILGTGTVIRRMRGHDNPVISLSWNPVVGNPFVKASKTRKESTELLLASGAGCRSAFVWRAGSDGQCQIELKQPTAPPGQPKPRNAGTTVVCQGNVMAVCWATSARLLTSTMWGELLCWNMDEIARWQVANEKTLFNAQNNVLGRTVFTQIHQRGIFSISCKKMTPPQDAEAQSVNWRQKQEPTDEFRPLIWTTSQDRQLVATDLSDGETRLALPTLGGFVYCMAVSKLDCHKVAIGAGDGTIRVWNMTDVTKLDLRSVWLRIKGRVTAVSWHPTHDSWLAYGTSEGRVGVYDMANSTKGPCHMWSFHRKSVFRLGWGPLAYIRGKPRSSQQTHFLYSCGDNMLLCYDLHKKEETFAEVQTQCHQNEEPLTVNVTEFSWKTDYSIVAIGTDTGCVHLCTAPYLDVKATVYPFKKMMQSLTWHPMATSTEPSGSSLCHHLAFASTENTVKIFNFDRLFSMETSLADTNSFTTITGHTDRVTEVAWNPHVGGMLVTTSYDCSAQVWDVRRGSVTLLALFSGHSAWVVTVAWCPMDPDFIISGSSDFTLRVWRISKQDTKPRSKPLVFMPPSTDTAATKARTKSKKTVKVEVEHVVAAPTPVVRAAPVKKSYFPVSSRSRNLGKDSFIMSTYSLLNNSKSNSEGQMEGSALGAGDIAHLGFFSDRAALNRMLELEGRQLKQSNLPEHAQNVCLWGSTNLTASLEKAILEKQVTLWHIAVSPMLSLRLWRDLVNTYAEQLLDEGRQQEAASMLVAVGKVPEAVEMLLSYNLYREAVCIVRCHLPEDEELRHRVLKEWANHAEYVGDFELAAQCYVSMGDLERAARTQGLRADSKSLELAVTLAEASGDDVLIANLTEQAIKKHVCEQGYERATVLADRNPRFAVWTWLIATHQEMVQCLAAIGKAATVAEHIDNWLTRRDSFAAVRDDIVARCRQKLGENGGNASSILGSIDGNPKNKHEVQLSTAANIAVSLSGETELANKRLLVTAFDICYRYHNVFPISRLLLAVIIFATQPPNRDRQQAPTGPDISIEGYVCAGLVRWMDQANTLFTPANLQEIVATLKLILPSAIDVRDMFYYNSVSQHEKYEKMILTPTNPEVTKTEPSENGVTEESCLENELGDLSLSDDSPKVESEKMEACPRLTLKRLRDFETFFKKTRVSAPNPYLLYAEVVRVLTQFKETGLVDEMLDKLAAAWKRREGVLETIWKDILTRQENVFWENDAAIASYWDSLENCDNSSEEF